MNGITDNIDSSKDDTKLDNLYLALTQCFAVIICGYLAGRTHMITQRETSGLNTFVGKFSLPSLIFISLCQIDLSSVNWMFIFAIFVSKTIIFFLVLLITVVVTRPTNTARAGLLAIFCTQTNDFAIGVPIVQALYDSKHQDYVAYLYLLAPISLTILNPFGFVMMEIGKQSAVRQNSQNTNENTRWQMIRSVIRNIISNPIVFMTALGIIGNQIFKHQPPEVLKSVLDVFGNAFTGTALMLLGLRMVGRVHTLQGTALLTPSLLIITKLLLTPLVMREIVALCLSQGSETEDLTTFAFLYGTLPSAPGVFVYANAYGLDIDLVAASMVSCTFLSAPLMLLSAKMIAAASMNTDDYNRLLEAFEFDISVLSLIGGLVVFVVLATKRKFRFPHRLTFFLITAQIIGCVSSILNCYGLVSVAKLMGIAGDMCAALCSASLAIALLFIHAGADPTLNSVQPALIVLPWGIPLCLTTILISLYHPPIPPITEPPEPFKIVSNGLSISVFMFSLIVTVVCLVLAERNRRQNARYSSITEDDLPASISSAVMSSSSRDKLLSKNDAQYDNMYDEHVNGDAAGELNRYYRSEAANAAYSEQDDMQLVRHFVFLMIIVCSFIVSLALKLWQLVNLSSSSGLYVEMNFIEITFRRGQALFGFCIFALDYRGVIKPMIKWAVKTWYGGEPITLPKWDTLPFETRLLCDQFVSQHLQKCKIDIEKTKWSSLLYGICFSGSSLVDWLVHHGVCKDSEEAGVYASKLLSGRVIRHIYNTEYFYNSPSMLYTFIVGS